MISFRFGECISDWGILFPNDFGMMKPQPSGPENLPLYPDDDGFYSVNGPAFHASHSKHPTTHPPGNQVSNSADQTPHISSNLRQNSFHSANAVGELVSPPDIPLPPSSLPTRFFRSNDNPQRFLQKKIYFCNEPGCTWPSPFPTKQGLTRHHQTKHLQKRQDCPIRGC
ncbi:hypothetical protein L873DRAFT_1193291 [Choiromyces venosus 120613-1]|uniref:Uncharacterized protein n=1 Tax=Choiromyces venosus 120613-1 TaxID=1336337 RepID=A0A3N4JK06_9PEZI|nr:hypothetical protein L873DRAFT_1193291 [Choiromyces venosus 120613-1]